MGNLAAKDDFGPSGSHFDFFQTPPSSPSAPDLPGMSLTRPSLSFSAPPSPTETVSRAGPATTSLSQAEDALMAEEASTVPPSEEHCPAEWERTSPRLEAGPLPPVRLEVGCPAGVANESATGELPDRVVAGAMATGVVPMEGVVTERVARALLQLLEQHRTALGIYSRQDGVAEVLGVLKRLVVERGEFIEEVQILKRTLESERSEWLQFQSDLQVAVAVADRLRAEAEESARELRHSQQEATDHLEATRTLLRQSEGELETLRAQHADVCQRLAQEQLKAQSSLQLDQSTQTSRPEEETSGAESRMPSRIPMQDSGRTSGREKVKEDGDGDGDEEERDGRKTSRELEVRSQQKAGEGSSDDGKVMAGGRGLREYERKTLPGVGLKDPRKIVMLSERSRSLSRLPLPSDFPPGLSSVIQTSSNSSQSQDPGRDIGRERRLDRLLQRQDSWSSFYTSKPDEDQSVDVSSVMVSKIRPDDSFSLLLRRHGGSRRNSLLRWCQRRTQGYKNIDITNFSTSWEDGLAFCAVYHTYLPTHIPYSTLSPKKKRENLDLAFKTGESVGVTALLTVEEMLSAGGPDWQRVLEYVESMFRHFEM